MDVIFKRTPYFVFTLSILSLIQMYLTNFAFLTLKSRKCYYRRTPPKQKQKKKKTKQKQKQKKTKTKQNKNKKNKTKTKQKQNKTNKKKTKQNKNKIKKIKKKRRQAIVWKIYAHFFLINGSQLAKIRFSFLIMRFFCLFVCLCFFLP